MKRGWIVLIWMVFSGIQASQLEKKVLDFCRQDKECPWSDGVFETQNCLVDAAMHGDYELADRLLWASHKPNATVRVTVQSVLVNALDLENEYVSEKCEVEWAPLQTLHLPLINLLLLSGASPKTKVNDETVFAWHVKKFVRRRNQLKLDKQDKEEQKVLQKEQQVHQAIISRLSEKMTEKEIDQELETVLPGHIDELKKELYPKTWWQAFVACIIL